MKLHHRDRRQFGFGKETLAAEFLISHGFELIERNFHCRMGEIDLIVRDKDYLVFVEVRFRRNRTFGSAQESVDKVKQAKIIRCAQYYLSKRNYLHSQSCRFDVIGIHNGQNRQSHDFQWIPDAFQL